MFSKSKDSVINIRLTAAQKKEMQQAADELFDGNLSLLVRSAVMRLIRDAKNGKLG